MTFPSRRRGAFLTRLFLSRDFTLADAPRIRRDKFFKP
jgi:hypothetical protein